MNKKLNGQKVGARNNNVFLKPLRTKNKKYILRAIIIIKSKTNK